MKSFSATDHKGVDICGKVFNDSWDSTLVLVEENNHPALPQTLWIIDQLEDVGVCLDVAQIQKLIPLLQSWMDSSTITEQDIARSKFLKTIR